MKHFIKSEAYKKALNLKTPHLDSKLTTYLKAFYFIQLLNYNIHDVNNWIVT